MGSNPWVQDVLASYGGPYRTSSSSEDQSSWAKVVGVPLSQGGKALAVWGQIVVSSLEKGPADSEAEVDFGQLGYVAVVAATAAAV